MKLEIAGKPFEFCPDDCISRSIEVNSKEFFANGALMGEYNTISCKHENACKNLYQHITNQ